MYYIKMPQCTSNTKTGARCKNTAKHQKCAIHQDPEGNKGSRKSESARLMIASKSMYPQKNEFGRQLLINQKLIRNMMPVQPQVTYYQPIVHQRPEDDRFDFGNYQRF